MAEAVRPPKTTGHLENLRGMQRGTVPPPPVANLIGFRLAEIDLGIAVFELNAEGRHANPMGTPHGGVLCDVGDAAMGCAVATTLEDDETFTTLDLSAKFFKPIWNASLVASAKVVRRTRSIAYIECNVHDQKGSLVARLDSTCLILRGDDAKGR